MDHFEFPINERGAGRRQVLRRHLGYLKEELCRTSPLLPPAISGGNSRNLSELRRKKIENLSRRNKHSEAIQAFNDALGVGNGFFGAEYVGNNLCFVTISGCPYRSVELIEYANYGDAYGKTLTFSWVDHCYRVTSYGDLIEFYERKGVSF